MLKSLFSRRRGAFLALAGFIALFAAAFASSFSPHMLAASILADSFKTPEYLKEKYADGKPVRVLIVPGHDEGAPGAEYRGLREEDVTLALSQNLYRLLETDARFTPFITRDESGYTRDFAEYFKREGTAIERFRTRLFGAMQDLFREGEAEPHRGPVIHNRAPSDVALRLYGINKWANENDIDVVLHAHFNDHNRAREPYRRYSGFSVYIPEQQLPNHDASRALATPIFDAIGRYFPASDLAGESDGIIENQSLIAIGANASLQSAALLVEYSYIYEGHIREAAIRPLALRELALQTYRGLTAFFGEEHDTLSSLSATLPHTWRVHLSESDEYRADTFALQIALSEAGFYPPAGKSGNDCPPTGYFGPCTREAVRAFQRAHGMPPVGVVGPQTLAELNGLYSYTTVFK